MLYYYFFNPLNRSHSILRIDTNLVQLCAKPAQPWVNLTGGCEGLRKDRQKKKAESGWDTDGETVPRSKLSIL